MGCNRLVASERFVRIFMAVSGVPGDLDATGKKLYRDLRAAMQERPDGPTQWTDPDHHLLSQACRYDHRARRAREEFAKDAESMVTLGDRRQRTVDPLVKIAEQSERAFVDVLKELGFSPKSRHQMSIEAKKVGESKFGLD
jgi:P27 family predicted phage terminase small subunit